MTQLVIEQEKLSPALRSDLATLVGACASTTDLTAERGAIIPELARLYPSFPDELLHHISNAVHKLPARDRAETKVYVRVCVTPSHLAFTHLPEPTESAGIIALDKESGVKRGCALPAPAENDAPPVFDEFAITGGVLAIAQPKPPRENGGGDFGVGAGNVYVDPGRTDPFAKGNNEEQTARAPDPLQPMQPYQQQQIPPGQQPVRPADPVPAQDTPAIKLESPAPEI